MPLPTSKLMLPLAPDVAEPLRSTIEPLLPSVVDPDFIDNDPERPPDPALAVLMVNAPLDVTDPNPPIKDVEPPVLSELSPALITIRPPAPSFPLPT